MSSKAKNQLDFCIPKKDNNSGNSGALPITQAVGKPSMPVPAIDFIRCKHCGKIKSSEEFYPHKLCWCKNCHIEGVRLWKQNNPERVRHNRNQPQRKKHQALYYEKWYKQNGRNRPPDYIESARKWQRLNPKKSEVGRLTRKAILEGRLIRPSICSVCSRKKKLVGHHEDYNYPLIVTWLCHSCHKKVHTQPREKANLNKGGNHRRNKRKVCLPGMQGKFQSAYHQTALEGNEY